ncbi:hypothetical protein ACYSNW_11085 [Enterococcus sp. LJL99]
MFSSENQVGTMHHRITTFFVIYRNKKEFPKIVLQIFGKFRIISEGAAFAPPFVWF